jgi:hypothetical protein
MTPLEELDQGWAWYEAARQSLRRIRRLGEKWSVLPWHGEAEMWRDNVVGKLAGEKVVTDAQTATSRLDDLAVIELFSIFEGVVRRLVVEQVGAASVSLTHPVLIAAARNAIEAAGHRSFAEILNSYSQSGHADIAEQVRQVRRYRNWLSHGRRGKEQRKIEPKTAYERLRKFLEIILPPPLPVAGGEEKPPDGLPTQPDE